MRLHPFPSTLTRSLRTLFVVGADADMAGSVVQRIGEGIGHMPVAPAVGVHGGFGDWAKSELASYPEWVRARRNAVAHGR
jgi:hypothetical protein